MTVNYTPGFQHTDWVDNVDRVRAAGDNGFNIRFHALEAEFARLAGVIGQVGAVLDELSRTPVATPVKLTLAPTLAPISGQPWGHFEGGAEKPGNATSAQGMMALSFPAGVTLKEFRVTGSKGGGALSIDLRRQSIAAGADTEQIVGLTPPNGAFDQSATVPAGPSAKVDNDQFRYYVIAQLDSAPAAAAVRLTCFQITTIAS